MPALSPDIPVNEVSINTIFPTFESRWQALINKDPRIATAFLYCVKSTHIYCRPICTARLARRKNVVFYDTVDEAEEAGFRPCKRCKPRLPLHETHHAMVRQSCQILDQSVTALPPLKDLAKSVGLTQWHFHRIFRRFAGVTPRMYWEARHNPEKQLKYNIDFNQLLRNLDGYSGEDPANHRGEVPRRDPSDPVITAPEDVSSYSSGSESNQAASEYAGKEGFNSTKSAGQATNSQSEFSGFNDMASSASNAVNTNKALPTSFMDQNSQKHDQDTISAKDDKPFSQNSVFSKHDPTPPSLFSTPLFDSAQPQAQQNQPVHSQSNSNKNQSNQSPSTHNPVPAYFPTDHSSNNTNSASKNVSVPDLSASESTFLPQENAVNSHAFDISGVVDSTFDPMGLSNKMDFSMDGIGSLDMLDSWDKLDLSQIDQLHSKNQEPMQLHLPGLDSSQTQSSHNIPHNGPKAANKNMSTLNHSSRYPMHPKSHSGNPATAQLSKSNFQINKPSQFNKNHKNQQRATQRSIPAWPQSPALLAQHSPSLFPQSPSLNAQPSPLLFPQSPNLGPFQSPALHALQSPSLAPVLERSPPTTFKSEVLARQYANQPLSAPSPISLSQSSPSRRDKRNQPSPNLAGINDNNNHNKGASIVSRARQLQNLYRQAQSAKALKSSSTGKPTNDSLNNKTNQAISGIPFSYGNNNTLSSSSSNSDSPSSSHSPVTGSQGHLQQDLRRSSNSSMKSSPGFASNGGHKNTDASGHLSTDDSLWANASNMALHGSNLPERITMNKLGSKGPGTVKTSELNSWLSGNMAKTLEGLSKGTEKGQLTRPPYLRSNSTPVWNNNNHNHGNKSHGEFDLIKAENGRNMAGSNKNINAYKANSNVNNIVNPIDVLSGGSIGHLSGNVDMDLFLGGSRNTNNNSKLNASNSNNSANPFGDLDVDMSRTIKIRLPDNLTSDAPNFLSTQDTDSIMAGMDGFGNANDDGNEVNGYDTNKHEWFVNGEDDHNNSNGRFDRGSATGIKSGNQDELEHSNMEGYALDHGLHTNVNLMPGSMHTNYNPLDTSKNSNNNNNNNDISNLSFGEAGNDNENTELSLIQYQQLRQHLDPAIRAQLDQKFQASYRDQLQQQQQQQKLKQQQQQQQKLQQKQKQQEHLRNLLQEYQKQQEQQQQFQQLLQNYPDQLQPQEIQQLQDLHQLQQLQRNQNQNEQNEQPLEQPDDGSNGNGTSSMKSSHLRPDTKNGYEKLYQNGGQSQSHLQHCEQQQENQYQNQSHQQQQQLDEIDRSQFESFLLQ